MNELKPIRARLETLLNLSDNKELKELIYSIQDIVDLMDKKKEIGFKK